MPQDCHLPRNAISWNHLIAVRVYVTSVSYVINVGLSSFFCRLSGYYMGHISIIRSAQIV